MDCEKFDSLIIDELYGELDELTSAAMKRHASGCSRCAAKLLGLKTTRELARLPEPELPPGFEERILAATREAAKLTPISRGRLSRAVSLAGTWAMRPQTAMAALFLLMIGSSAVLLRSRQPRESAALTVTQEGSPSPQVMPAEDREFDGKGAAAAHGATPGAPMVAAATERPKATVGAATAADDLGALASAGRDEAKKEKERGDSPAAGGGAQAGPLAMGPAAPAAAPPAARAASNTATREETSDAFASGMSAYQARRYAEATRKLDEATAQGNPAAALWAARSVRDASGCAAAVGRFNAVAARGGVVGHDATFDAARCYDSMGDREGAKSRYRALLSVPAYAARAQAALDSSTEMASRGKAAAAPPAADPSGGARSTPGKNAAPRPAPAAVDRAAY